MRRIYAGAAVLVAMSFACPPTAPPPRNQNAPGNDNAAVNDNASANDNAAANDNSAANDNIVENVNDNGSSGGVELGVDLEVPNEGQAHVASGTQVSYASNPPASGTHWPNWAQPGFYASAVEEEEWVHSLEHGYVVVLFDCDGPCAAELLDDLEALVDAAPPSGTFGYAKIVVTPYDGLAEPALITAVAWDVQMHLAEFDEAALLDFYGRYLDQGPELAP